MSFGRIPEISLLLLGVLLMTPAFAGPVALSETGEGSALIAPLWTVRDGHDTLISLRNNGAVATVAKVRLIEADGVEAVSFNVYLGQYDTWVAALTNAGSDQAPDDQLVTKDSTCILPNPARDEAGVARIALPELVHGNGYIEIVEMGSSTVTGPAGSSLSLWHDCETLSDRFETGIWTSDTTEYVGPPHGRLSALVHLINVGVGGMVSPNVTALSGFTDVIQHTAPGSNVPNLATAHTSDTASGLTESRVCDADGCDVHAWNQPVEAVASVLVAERLEASYSAKSSHGAVTQFVYTRPLARFESEVEDGFAIDGNVLFAERNREGEEPDGGPCLPEPPPVIAPGDRICGTRYFVDDWVLAVEALQFGQGFEAEQGSSMLGTSDPLIIESLPDRFNSGVLQMVVSQNLGDGDRLLISADGEVFPGDVIIGFAVQQRTNGTLINPDGQSVRANYRSEQNLIRARVLEASAFGGEE